MGQLGCVGSVDLSPGKEKEKEKNLREQDGQTQEHAHVLQPRPLAPLPSGLPVAELWAGSEYTMAADLSGALWAVGWNEHGNLGIGAGDLGIGTGPSASASAAAARDGNGRNGRNGKLFDWTRVVGGGGDPVRVDASWVGSLALGGGHAVCVMASASNGQV
jgi:hypothetical protein